MTKEIINEPTEIRKSVLKYCKNLLTNRPPSEDFEEDIKIKRILHEKRMEEKVSDDSSEMSIELFNKSMEELWKTKKTKYDFIVKGGYALKNAIFYLFRKVWETEMIPEGWNRTTLLQLPKSKGDFRNQDNTRFIHLKDQIPKMFSHIIINQVKDLIMKNMTPYQIGKKKGHKSQENIFVMISMMKLNQLPKNPLIIQLYDISKFFDKEHLPDVMEELYGSGVRGKNYRLIYKLNEKRIIKVDTAVGLTEEEEVSEGIGQGTLDGAITSANSIGRGVDRYFSSSPWEAHYGQVRLQPFSFLDDIGRLSSSPQAALAGNLFLSSLMEEKLLSFNISKSVCLVVGENTEARTMKQKLKHNPLQLGKSVMKTVEQYMYLGIVLDDGGSSASFIATIEKRTSRVKQQIFEIKAILQDTRLDSVGGISAGLDLWQLIVVPYLYASLECFPDFSEEALKKLEDLHLLFYRCLLNCPRSSPIGGMFWFLGQTLPINILMKKTVMLYFHIANLSSDSFAKEVINEQQRLGIDGLASQGRRYLAELGVRESIITVTSKAQFKRIISDKIKLKNTLDILQIYKKYIKS